MRRPSLSRNDLGILRDIAGQKEFIADRFAISRLADRALVVWVWGRCEITARGEEFLSIADAWTSPNSEMGNLQVA